MTQDEKQKAAEEFKNYMKDYAEEAHLALYSYDEMKEAWLSCADWAMEKCNELESRYEIRKDQHRKAYAKIEQLQTKCERYEKAINEIDQMLIDSVVVCRKCGDEETLQDSDMKYVIEALRKDG
jgi:chromosome segregation ATPase